MPAKLDTTTDSTRLKAVFGAGFPVVEATEALDVTVYPRHVKGATAKSAPCCAIAKALETHVAILRSCAYILENNHGQQQVKHYKHADSAKAFVAMFDTVDKHGKSAMHLSGPVTVRFLPPPPAQTREAARKRHAKRMKAAKRLIKRMGLKVSPSEIVNPNKHAENLRYYASAAGKLFRQKYKKAKQRGVVFTARKGDRTIVINPEGNCYARIKTMKG